MTSNNNTGGGQLLPVTIKDKLPVCLGLLSAGNTTQNSDNYRITGISFYGTDLYLLDAIFKPISNIL